MTASAPTRLEEAVTGGAIRSVNFFNGRLLTGDDLRREQEAERARLARLGQAAGEGIAYGLEVAEALSGSSAARPVVTIEPGLAVARSGLALELPARTDVSLLREHPGDDAEAGGLFADCQPFATGTYTAGAGVYLLTMEPARTSEGLAAVSGLTNDPAPCNTDVSLEAVKFRLIRLALLPSELTDTSHLRNRIAHLFFGSDKLAKFIVNPFGPVVGEYGLLDQLRAGVLTDDETPLAVIAWTADEGIRFVDLWSVRRLVTRWRALDAWAPFAEDRRRQEGEAMLLQFQDELADLRHVSDPSAIRAGDHFRRLPPAGILPLAGSFWPPAFDLMKFFVGATTAPPVFAEGARIAGVLEASFHRPPIDLAKHEAIRLYLVRENEQAELTSSPSPQPYAVFADGRLPYAGDAELDLAYWNFASYARCC